MQIPPSSVLILPQPYLALWYAIIFHDRKGIAPIYNKLKALQKKGIFLFLFHELFIFLARIKYLFKNGINITS